MSKYKVHYRETRWIVDYVDADNEDEAYDLFHNKSFKSSDYGYGAETKLEEIEDE